jgi:pimeloyl-ACP methyl ester carboxylesterase
MSEYIGVFKRLRQRAEDARSKLRPRVFKPDAPRTVRVDDILVAIRVFGEGDPLFMIPAYVSTMDQWDPDFLSRLAMHHTVVIFDNRGLGGTTPGYAEFTMDRFALDTAGLIQALGYERAHVLGWSIGGDIALCLAANHPERVMKLVSYAGDCGGPQKIAAPAYKEILKKLHGVQGVMMKDLLAALFPAWWMEAHPDYWKQFPVPRGIPNPLHIVQQDNAYESWEGVYDRLPDMRIPVMALTGTEDDSTPPENARILAERLPDCKLVEFPGAGHGLQYMYPIGLANVIIDFLGE